MASFLIRVECSKVYEKFYYTGYINDFRSHYDMFLFHILFLTRYESKKLLSKFILTRKNSYQTSLFTQLLKLS